MKKALTIAAVAALSTLALSACSTGGANSSSTSSGAQQLIIVVGFAPAGFNEATKLWQNGYDKATSELKNTKVEYKLPGAITFDAKPIDDLINAAIAQKPNAIVVDSSAGPATESTLEKAIKAGIKVVAVDNPLPGLAGLTSYVGTDNEAAGEAAGKAMVTAFKAGKLKSADVAILGSTPGSASLDQRTAGFKKGIQGSGLNVVAEQQPTCDTAKAQSGLTDILTAHPNLGGAFSNCGQTSQGIANALVNTKHTDVEQFSVDTSAALLALVGVPNSGVTGLVQQDLYGMTYTALKTASAAINGQKVEASISIDTTTVTSDNVASVLSKYNQQLKG